jgi:hypothetical protein
MTGCQQDGVFLTQERRNILFGQYTPETGKNLPVGKFHGVFGKTKNGSIRLNRPPAFLLRGHRLPSLNRDAMVADEKNRTQTKHSLSCLP